LHRQTGLPIQRFLSALTNLELSGVIVKDAHGWIPIRRREAAEAVLRVRMNRNRAALDLQLLRKAGADCIDDAVGLTSGHHVRTRSTKNAVRMLL
jgi:hypothetical protein